MKIAFRLLFVLLCLSISAYAQIPNQRSLTVDGNELANQKDYAGAIEKYKAALALDTAYAPANYQMGFALNALGKGMDAIPYLQRVIVSPAASAILTDGAYNLAGGIYDKNNFPKKAIECYEATLKFHVNDQSVYYNMALVYFHTKEYNKAEDAIARTIKLDKNVATYMRLWSLSVFHQNKRVPALQGLCTFLILEPNTARSKEAYGNIQHIIQGGRLTPEAGATKTDELAGTDADANNLLTKTLDAFRGRRYATPADLLDAQLAAIFKAFANIRTGKHWLDPWFSLAEYYGKLAQSPNMPAFARFVSQSQPESAAWIKAHPKQMADLDNWLKTTQRGFDL